MVALMSSVPLFPAEEVEQALGVARAELLGCGAFGIIDGSRMAAWHTP
jgi:hypothetical protein